MRSIQEVVIGGGIIGGGMCIDLFFLLMLIDLRIVFVGIPNIGMIGDHLVIRIFRILIEGLKFIGILLAF